METGKDTDIHESIMGTDRNAADNHKTTLGTDRDVTANRATVPLSSGLHLSAHISKTPDKVHPLPPMR